MASTSSTSGLPLVPLSPLIKSTITCTNALNQATDKLKEAKNSQPAVPVNTLRRLVEDTKVERSRLDNLQRQIQSVESATAFNWDPDVLARQVAAINCQLFNRVVLEKKWFCQLEKKQTNLVYLLDFHHYLTHSVAHQLIFWAELSQQKSGMAARVVPTVHPKDNLISHLVRVAYLLVHAYRDFSGFAAIMRALRFPEVRRLRKLWHGCPSRTRELYRELAQLMSPANNHKAYHEMLRRKLELYYHPSPVSGASSSEGLTIAIPWIQPHLAMIRSIISAYTAGDNDPAAAATSVFLASGGGGQVVLSAPGARKLAMVMATLELCQTNATSESPDLVEEIANSQKALLNSKRLSSATRKPIQLDGLRSPVSPVPDLNRLLPGDLVAQHWLLSRVYLTKDQLIEESIEVEPLLPGEQLACDADDEEEDLQLERDMAEADATLALLKSAPATAANSRRASVSLEAADNDDDDDDHDQDGGDPVVEPVAEAQKPTTTTTTTTTATTENEEDLQKIWATKEEGEHSREKSLATQSTATATTSTQQESAASKQTIKSTLSPTAPEFIPSSKKLMMLNATTSLGPSSVVVSPASSVQAEPTVTNQEEEEDPEEQWHGYPGKEDSDTDSETWYGYPSPASETKEEGGRRDSVQSEESEEWKGYHASKVEASWQREIDLKVQDHDWQGYALETLNEDELDSSTMMDGEFEKSRQARRKDTYEAINSWVPKITS